MNYLTGFIEYLIGIFIFFVTFIGALFVFIGSILLVLLSTGFGWLVVLIIVLLILFS